MATCSEVTFNKRLANLQQIVSGRLNFPIVVKTKDALRSFQEVPVEAEGMILFLESQMRLKYALIRVLNSPDKVNLVPKCGEGCQQTDSSLVGKEFYIPLGCPGKLQIIPYPGKRRRYVSVSEVMQDNPRYVLSISDVMTIPPRQATDKCLKCISAGTTVELKAIIQHESSRYLKCVDKDGACYFLQEHCRVNFIAMSDGQEYTLQQVKDAGILLPTPVQFIRGTITPYDVIPFHDIIANITLEVTDASLELLQIVERKVMIAKVRDNDNHCFKTILLPQTLYENFYVQVGEFRHFETQSIFMERKFGGCRGDNDFIYKKMYLMPTEDKQVCWLRNPEKLTGNVHFCASSDSDSDGEYVIPEVISDCKKIPLPPLPDRRPIKDIGEEQGKLKEMFTTKIKDQYVLQSTKGKNKQLKTLSPSPPDMPLGTVTKPMKSKESRSKVKTDLTKTSLGGTGTTTHVEPPLGPVGGKRLPPFPPDEPLKSVDDMFDNEQHEYTYIDMSNVTLPGPADDKHVKVTARIEPIPFKVQHTEDIVTETPERELDCQDYLVPIPSSPTEVTVQPHRNLSDRDFFTYSVTETVDCLKMCGMDNLAELCKEMTLDGEFLQNTEQSVLKESFGLSSLDGIKLRRICQGWRPKHT